MISLLRGKIAEKNLGNIILDVAGVGYGVALPLPIFYKLPELGAEIELKIHTHIKENSLELFGFLTNDEKSLFLSLIGISGIGPKAATNILSNISVEELIESIQTGDLVKKKVPGIGPKTAARITNELKDKLAAISSAKTINKVNNNMEDVVSALVNLGYTKPEIDENFSNIEDIVENADSIEVALRDSLKIMKRK